MMKQNQKVLIFGINGFVGSYLSRELAQNGYRVYGSGIEHVCQDKNSQGYFQIDITNAKKVQDICRMLCPDIIVNLAAISSVGQSWAMPAITIDVNVCGAINILEAVKEQSNSPKVLLVGSSEEYAPSNYPLKEEDSIDATNPYGISKVTQERVAEMYESRYELRIYRTRSFNHTGIGQSTNFVLPNWLSQIAAIERSGDSGILKVGNIDVVRDFSDVRDMVRAYRLLVESDQYGTVFNLGSGNAYSLRDILEQMILLSDQRIDIEIDTKLLRPNDNPFICCDPQKYEAIFGKFSRIPLKHTFYEMFQYFLQTKS